MRFRHTGPSTRGSQIKTITCALNWQYRAELFQIFSLYLWWYKWSHCLTHLLNFRARGYQYSNDGTLEDQSSFLNRMTGIFMLYVAIILTDPRKNQPHPYGLQNAWKWIAATINLGNYKCENFGVWKLNRHLKTWSLCTSEWFYSGVSAWLENTSLEDGCY